MKFVRNDYYEILDVDAAAGPDEVKRAYRQVRHSFRPDSMAMHALYTPSESEAIVAKIEEAFRILSAPESARRYGRYSRSARPGARIPRDPDTFFDELHDVAEPGPVEQLAHALAASQDASPADVPGAVPPRTPEAQALSDGRGRSPRAIETGAEMGTGEVRVLATVGSAGDPALGLDSLEELPESAIDAVAAEALAERLAVAPVAAAERVAPVPATPFGLDTPAIVRIAPMPPATPFPQAPGTPAPRIAIAFADPPPATREPVAAPPTAPALPRVAIAFAEVQPAAVVELRPTATGSGQPDPTARPLPGAQVTAPTAAVAYDFDPKPRRWTRDTVRTVAVGALQFEPLSRETLDAIQADCGGINGAYLRTVRRELSVSVQDIASRTKIAIAMIEWIEADALDNLPARVYLRGYLLQYARLLKLDDARTADGYLARHGL